MSNIKSILDLLNARDAMDEARWQLDNAIDARVNDPADAQREAIAATIVELQNALAELAKPATFEVQSIDEAIEAAKGRS